MFMADLSLSIRNFEGKEGLESLIYVKGGLVFKNEEDEFQRFCLDYMGSCKNSVKIHLDTDNCGTPLIRCLVRLREKCIQDNLDFEITYPTGKREDYENLYTFGIHNVIKLAEKDYNFV
jgi:hypothetical protein